MKSSSLYTHLALRAIEEKIKTGQVFTFEQYKMEIDDPEWIREVEQTQAGAFVSLYIEDELRGCIGTVEGIEPHIGEEIIKNALEAAFFDSRFQPVGKKELERLAISVDILKQKEPVESIKELDPQKYGVVVEHQRKRGLLLPALEGVDTPEKQLDIAAKKAGIMEGEKMRVYRFEVTRHR
jgi:MEMO1 family protein